MTNIGPVTPEIEITTVEKRNGNFLDDTAKFSFFIEYLRKYLYQIFSNADPSKDSAMVTN